MIHSITTVAATAAGALAACSLGYYALCLWSARAFLRERHAGEGARATPPTALPVSILKPLRGTDPEMYESFRSHCLQDYPEYEIIFGVSDDEDPAIKLVERLQLEFPRHSIHLLALYQKPGVQHQGEQPGADAGAGEIRNHSRQ